MRWLVLTLAVYVRCDYFGDEVLDEAARAVARAFVLDQNVFSQSIEEETSGDSHCIVSEDVSEEPVIEEFIYGGSGVKYLDTVDAYDAFRSASLAAAGVEKATALAIVLLVIEHGAAPFDDPEVVHLCKFLEPAARESLVGSLEDYFGDFYDTANIELTSLRRALSLPFAINSNPTRLPTTSEDIGRFAIDTDYDDVELWIDIVFFLLVFGVACGLSAGLRGLYRLLANQSSHHQDTPDTNLSRYQTDHFTPAQLAEKADALQQLLIAQEEEEKSEVISKSTNHSKRTQHKKNQTGAHTRHRGNHRIKREQPPNTGSSSSSSLSHQHSPRSEEHQSSSSSSSSSEASDDEDDHIARARSLLRRSTVQKRQKNTTIDSTTRRGREPPHHKIGSHSPARTTPHHHQQRHLNTKTFSSNMSANQILIPPRKSNPIQKRTNTQPIPAPTAHRHSPPRTPQQRPASNPPSPQQHPIMTTTTSSTTPQSNHLVSGERSFAAALNNQPPPQRAVASVKVVPLPPQVRDDDLRSKFAQYGGVVGVRVFTSASPPHGYVDFSCRADAVAAAFDAHGKSLFASDSNSDNKIACIVRERALSEDGSLLSSTPDKSNMMRLPGNTTHEDQTTSTTLSAFAWGSSGSSQFF